MDQCENNLREIKPPRRTTFRVMRARKGHATEVLARTDFTEAVTRKISVRQMTLTGNPQEVAVVPWCAASRTI